MSWKEAGMKFREVYKFPIKASMNWFPGHMTKGLRQMERMLKETDLVIEVHDARIPVSGRNLNFKRQITTHLPHLLVLNKKDLIPDKDQTRLRDTLKNSDPSLTNVLFTNCKDSACKGLNQVLPQAISSLNREEQLHRLDKPATNVLIVGIPNVGKSSLINALRQRAMKIGGRPTPVGNTPGVTRSVLTKIRVCNEPVVYLVDTPGIMMPNIRDMHVGMKLALCATINDHRVGIAHIADYLLFHMNKIKNFSYVDYLKLPRPFDSISECLIAAASALNMKSVRKDLTTNKLCNYPDIERVALYFVNGFRQGHLGKVLLDEELLEKGLVSKSKVHGSVSHHFR